MPMDTPADGEVRGRPRMARRREAGPGEAQQLVLDVRGDGAVGAVLHVPAVDAERGQALLRVRRELHGREVHRARAARGR